MTQLSCSQQNKQSVTVENTFRCDFYRILSKYWYNPSRSIFFCDSIFYGVRNGDTSLIYRNI